MATQALSPGVSLRQGRDTMERVSEMSVTIYTRLYGVTYQKTTFFATFNSSVFQARIWQRVSVQRKLHVL